MKIEIKNIFKGIINKFKFKKINVKKQAKVIKFESPLSNFEEKNEVEDVENIEKTTRKGAYVKPEKKPHIKLNKRAQKLFISMLMLLLLTTSLNIRYKDYLSLEEYQPKDVSSVAVSNSVDNLNISNNETVKATKAEEKVVTTTTTKKVEEKLVFSAALKGEIQKMYSVDKVIYSKTLEQWKTHDGIDIAATNSKEVKAIEKGIVESIYNDSFYGMTIEIEHINGYRSVYSNLDENVYVNVGESVIKGQKIGKVGNTSVGEYLDETHLHFMLFLNDKSIDPTYIFD